MKDIAVICATPRNDNPGMRAVDLAAYNILKKNKLLDKTTFFCFDIPNNLKHELFKYETIVNFYPKNYKCIIIWGDFLLSRHWQHKIKERLEKEVENNLSIIEEKLLLSNQPDHILKKVIVYGQCIFVDNIHDIKQDKEYINSIKRILLNSRIVRFRDPISYFRAKMILHEDYTDESNIGIGVDAALLNSNFINNDIKGNKKKTSGGKTKVGIYLGRSSLRFATLVLLYDFIKLKYFIDLSWIPWLSKKTNRYYKIFNKINKCKYIERPKNINLFYKLVSRYDVIITDTYHLCIVALTLGVRVICIGSGTKYFDDTLGDKKKEILFTQMSHSHNYFYIENSLKEIKNNFFYKLIMNRDREKEEIQKNIIYSISKKEIEIIEKEIFYLINK